MAGSTLCRNPSERSQAGQSIRRSLTKREPAHVKPTERSAHPHTSTTEEQGDSTFTDPQWSAFKNYGVIHMQHTNSQRGSDGKFSQSDAPKAKRIEVWLQPQTVELLDTLTKQWGVGRGKVIDQLLTRGPVPPKSWSEVTESPPPTPSAPPEPPEPRFKVGDKVTKGNGLKAYPIRRRRLSDAGWMYEIDSPLPCGFELESTFTAAPPPEPSPVDFVSDWGVLPSNASKRQWIAVNVTLNADLTRSGYGVENFLDQTLRTVAAIRKEGVSIGKACNPGAMPQFRFLMNVDTAKPFTAGYDVPAVAIEMAADYVRKVYPKTKPEPTTSGRATVFDDPEFIAMQEKMSQQWDIAKADAKVIGCKPERVQRFKARQKLNPDRPLSVDAQQLLRDELEAEQRSAKGEANALQDRLQRLKERATNQRLAQIANASKSLPVTITSGVARIFLLEGLEIVGIRRRSKLVKGLWSDLERLIPSADQFDEDRGCFPTEDNTVRRCLFWGTAIRLATLDGEPPEDIAAFLDWCGYSVHQSEQERQANQRWSEFARTMSGKPSVTSDRQVLDLPEQGELTAAAIKSAFKSLARKHHPDAGGDAVKFQRIAEAKDRLMLEVAA